MCACVLVLVLVLVWGGGGSESSPVLAIPWETPSGLWFPVCAVGDVFCLHDTLTETTTDKHDDR